MSGYIYALTNESIPGQIKLGRTVNHPEDRAADLSSDTGVPTPFTVAYFVAVSDDVQAEKSIHRTFKRQRVNPKREFFEISVDEARAAMDKLTYRYPVDGGLSMRRFSGDDMFYSVFNAFWSIIKMFARLNIGILLLFSKQRQLKKSLRTFLKMFK